MAIFRKGLSINKEVFLLGLLSCIAMALAFSGYFSILMFNESMETASKALEGTNSQIKVFSEGLFGEINNLVEVLAASPDVRDAVHGDPDVVRRVLAQYGAYEAVNSNIRYIYSGYEDGSLLINAYVPPAGFDSTTRPWYTAAVQSYPAASIGMPYQEIIDEEQLLSQSKAFRDETGEIAGVFAIDCSLQGLVDLIGQRYHFQTQRTYIVDAAGVIILHPDQRSVGSNGPPIPQQLGGDRGLFSYSIDDREALAYYAKSAIAGWTFVTAVDRQEVLQPLKRRIALYAFFVVLMAFLLVTVQVKIFKMRFSEPLIDLGRRVAAMTEGRSVEPLKRHSNPEIAEIRDNIECLTKRSLDRHRRELETILKSVREGILVFDHKRTVVYANARLTELMEIPSDLLASRDGTSVLKAIAERLGTDAGSIGSMTDLDSSARLETIACADGLILELYSCPFRDVHGSMGRLCSFRDITEQSRAVKEIEYLSFHDGLTGLYNRRFFDEELRRLDVPRNLPLTLLMLDVNGLKLTNDAFGHPVGDELLIRVANVLRDACRADDIIARVGGDEFAVLVPRANGDQADQLIQRVQQSVALERLEGLPISVSCGRGTKLEPQDSITDVFKTAEDQMYQHKTSERSSYRHQSIDLIMQTLYARSPREQQQSERVGRLCGAIGAAMGLEANMLTTAGMLHDIGKIAIGNEILDKRGPLSAAEWKEVKRHPEVGYSILSAVNDYALLADYVLAHHERWDGRGYPRGLKAEEIPLAARIIAVADSYDAMVSDRPYRQGMDHDNAIAEIAACAGSQFDPAVAEVFIAMIGHDEAAAAQDGLGS